MPESKIMPLQQLYLSVLVAVANSEKLDAVQQDLGEDAGRLYLVRKETTVPHMIVQYKFGVDDVLFGVIHRDERHFDKRVKYAEGMDGFLEEFCKFIQANLLAAPRARRAA